MYYLSKANIVVDALHRLSMGSITHIEEGKKELVKEVQRLAYTGVRLSRSNDGLLVQSRVESTLVVTVKEKQDIDPTFVELKKLVTDQKIMVSHEREMEYFVTKASCVFQILMI